MSKRVTMADVAREAGVSLMTVSRAINNKDGISATTRDRVRTIANRLGYRPSLIARSLVTDRTGTIGLVVIDNANPYFSEVARGVEHAAYREGYSVFLCNTEEDTQRERDVLRSLEEKRVDGIVLCSSRLDESELETALTQSNMILINRQTTNRQYGTVMVDDVRGAQEATNHLIDRGHRRIGFLAGPERSFSAHQRLDGYHTALINAGITPAPAWERHSLPIVDSAREAAHTLLSESPELTGLVCHNDLSAIGAIQACGQLGRAIPSDLAIVGFDDIPLAALVTPALTTCHVPMYDIGQTAMQLLIQQIQEQANGHHEVTFQPELVIRDTT